MEFKPSKGFIEDMGKLAVLCLENGTDNIDLKFNVGDGRILVIGMTFSAEDGDPNG